MYKVFLVYILMVFACSLHPKEQANVLYAKDLYPYGRSEITTDNTLNLISSAVHFGFTFQGKTCTIYTSLPSWLDHNYLQYELDGVYQKRIKVSKNANSVTIKASNDGKHTVWIYKATEATTGGIFIDKIEGNNLNALHPSPAPLIEFIGNSITSGAQSDVSEMPCGVGEYRDYTNAYMAYGPRVARALGVNFILSSVSGIGIYRTWNKDEPSMPQVYEKTDFQVESKSSWNFKLYTPKVVSIALGTNDLSDGDGQSERAPFDSSRFVTAYIDFIRLVHSKYADARIALLSSPMESGVKKILLERCLTEIKKNIDDLHFLNEPVAVYFFEPMQPRGCSNHPSIEDHAILAKELIPFFKKLL